jgi:hypothetical protein
MAFLARQTEPVLDEAVTTYQHVAVMSVSPVTNSPSLFPALVKVFYGHVMGYGLYLGRDEK